jgi:hypothetical protein
MKSRKLHGLVLGGIVLLGLMGAACSRLLPPRHGESRSFELVLDTRRAPSVALSGCFIPAVFPAVTKLPIEFITKIPPTAVFTGVRHEVILQNGEMKVLEPIIENNHVYLKFAVPSVDSFTQFHVVVYATYEYR